MGLPEPAHCGLRWPALCHLPQELVRGEPRLFYIVCWQWLGQRSGVLSLDLAEIASLFGASVRAAGRWIDSLERAGLVQIIARFPRGVEFLLRDYRSARSLRCVQAPESVQLDLFPAEEGTIPIRSMEVRSGPASPG